MKKRRGGARAGAGRPKKADEEKVRGLILSAIKKKFGSEEGLWEHICDQAIDGCSKHMTLLLNYTYGKPTERKPDVDPNEGKEKVSSVTLVL